MRPLQVLPPPGKVTSGRKNICRMTVPLQPAWMLVEQEARDSGFFPHEGGWAARDGPPGGLEWGWSSWSLTQAQKTLPGSISPTPCPLPVAMSNLPAARRLCLVVGLGVALGQSKSAAGLGTHVLTPLTHPTVTNIYRSPGLSNSTPPMNTGRRDPLPTPGHPSAHFTFRR